MLLGRVEKVDESFDKSRDAQRDKDDEPDFHVSKFLSVVVVSGGRIDLIGKKMYKMTKMERILMH